MSFLQKVEEGVKSCGLSCAEVFRTGNKLGFGVSGGADSIALLYSAILLRQKYYGEDGADFFVVSVNHNIRPAEESLKDSIFVRDFCNTFKNVSCTIVEFEKGYIERLAKQRNRGIEEAARHLRYEAFSREAKNNCCQHFFLAHNQNDQRETLLLRFLQGSEESGNVGIPSVRDIFLRPLLHINRREIEDFLIEKKIEWVTDKSNFTNDYLRNRCRNLLIPLLDKEFSGWEKSILTGLEKSRIDNDFINSQLPLHFWEKDKENNLFVSWDSFLNLHIALRRRILYQGLNSMGLDVRIPYHLVQGLSKITSKYTKGRIFSCGQIEVCGEVENLVIKLLLQNDSKEFSMIIDSVGEYCIQEFNITLKVKAGDDSKKLSLCGLQFIFPFVIRSPQPGDKCLINGRPESVLSILSKKGKDLMCVVEECGADFVAIVNLSQFET